MMPNELHNSTDLEQLIKDARYARMKFVRENFRVFAYGSSLLGLLCAFAITVLSSRERKSLRAGEHGTSANQPRGESPQISCSVIE